MSLKETEVLARCVTVHTGKYYAPHCPCRHIKLGQDSSVSYGYLNTQLRKGITILSNRTTNLLVDLVVASAAPHLNNQTRNGLLKHCASKKCKQARKKSSEQPTDRPTNRPTNK